MKERKEQFQKLLEEANLHGKYVQIFIYCIIQFFLFKFKFTVWVINIRLASRSSFSDFAQKHGRDDRFKNVEKMRERESLFNEWILEVRKREKEEKNAKREQVSIIFATLIVIILKVFFNIFFSKIQFNLNSLGFKVN